MKKQRIEPILPSLLLVKLFRYIQLGSALIVQMLMLLNQASPSNE